MPKLLLEAACLIAIVVGVGMFSVGLALIIAGLLGVVVVEVRG